MIVFDLRCTGGHVFEAWFGSSASYADQRERGLIACPICGDVTIEKAMMAPNIAAKGNRATPAPTPVPGPAADAPPPPEAVKAALASLAAAQKRMTDQSTWVGGGFPERARAMHRGDEAPAPIHGQATRADARALSEEGIGILPLPFPVVPPNARN